MTVYIRLLTMSLLAIALTGSNFDAARGTAAKAHGLAPGAEAATLSDITIDRIQVQLLNETSGTLSRNVVGDKDFEGWNVVAPGDDGREAATDLLVSVVLRSKTPEADINQPLTVTAKVLKGKLLARRTFHLVSTSQGQVTAFLLLPDATCAGGIVIDAVYGKQHKSEEVDFNCGE